MDRIVNILVVDDDPNLRKTLSDILKAKGYVPLIADKGKTALDIAKEQMPFVALIDLKLEDISGLEVIRGIKESSPGTECILLTGFASQESAIEAVNLGAYSYLQKPYDIEQLLLTVRRAVEKKKAEKALRHSEQRLAGIIASVTDHISMIDENHNIVWTTDLAKRLFGPDLIGKKCYAVYHRRDKICVPCVVSQTFADGKTHEHETEVTEVDGKIINFWCTANVAAWYGDGRPKLVVEVFRDITERKRLENQLRQAQKMEAIGTLAGGIAHDFNNILSPIMGYTEMTLSDLTVDSEIRSNLNQVLKAAERARDMIAHILAFSRQTGGERKPVELAPIIREALKLLKSVLPTTIEIRQNIAPDTGVVSADPTQIHQVLMNLCTNAEHAMQKGGVLEVSLANVDLNEMFCAGLDSLIPGSYVQLTITDTGCGIDKETLERIFDPFFTTKGPDKGTGMGLSVVHGIVKSHGGAITVQSESDTGTTFNVYLPVIETVAETRPEKAEPVRSGTESILFVDDEIILATLGRETLKRFGYRVTIRTSSIEALELFRVKSDEFDLVITDQTMPNMTGLNLAAEMLRIKPNIPIILCTGFSHAVTPAKVRTLGIREMVLKPIIGEQLGRTVRRVLDDVSKEIEKIERE